MRRRVIPGFGVAMGTTALYLGFIVLLPLAALLLKAADLGLAGFVEQTTSPRALAAYRVTLSTAAAATLFNAVFGLMLAWALVRYDFFGKRILDALVDVPFALPTAVAGVALAAVLAENGWIGAPLSLLGIKVAFTPLGIVVAMAFTSLPFVVRTVQPVLAESSAELEEAARTLGAPDGAIFRRVILPTILPALLAGCSLAFARSLGEFGAIIFIAGNQAYYTEVVSLLTFIRLEEFDYPAAAAIASVMLGTALVMLLTVNAIQLWQLRYMKAA
jgi:sulfate/thiosulfate transport system permease protein